MYNLVLKLPNMFSYMTMRNDIYSIYRYTFKYI